jgi:hypothetical protein
MLVLLKKEDDIVVTVAYPILSKSLRFVSKIVRAPTHAVLPGEKIHYGLLSAQR